MTASAKTASAKTASAKTATAKTASAPAAVPPPSTAPATASPAGEGPPEAQLKGAPEAAAAAAALPTEAARPRGGLKRAAPAHAPASAAAAAPADKAQTEEASLRNVHWHGSGLISQNPETAAHRPPPANGGDELPNRTLTSVLSRIRALGSHQSERVGRRSISKAEGRTFALHLLQQPGPLPHATGPSAHFYFPSPGLSRTLDARCKGDRVLRMRRRVQHAEAAASLSRVWTDFLLEVRPRRQLPRMAHARWPPPCAACCLTFPAAGAAAIASRATCSGAQARSAAASSAGRSCRPQTKAWCVARASSRPPPSFWFPLSFGRLSMFHFLFFSYRTRTQRLNPSSTRPDGTKWQRPWPIRAPKRLPSWRRPPSRWTWTQCRSSRAAAPFSFLAAVQRRVGDSGGIKLPLAGARGACPAPVSSLMAFLVLFPPS